MLFSICIPVYNTSKYLEECLQSVLCQTEKDYEIVLVDDGSTDHSGEICDRYAAQYPNIRVIHKENEGLLLTRRRGFAEARGDWFLCVDSDDYVAPNLLETVVKTVKTTDADMVMFNFEYFNEEGIHTPSRLKLADGTVFQGEDKQRIYEQRLLSVDVNMMWMRAIRRDVLDADADYSNCGIRNMCEDALQVLPLYTKAEKIVYRDVPLYYYRKSGSSITAKGTKGNWDAIRKSFLLTEPYLMLWNISEQVQSRFYTQHQESLCNYLRWMFSAKAEELPASLSEMVEQLKAAPDFVVSQKNYRREYAHSRYLAVVVPVLAHFVETGNIFGIRLVLNLEKTLLRILRK